MATKKKEIITPELVASLVAIAISIFALWLVIENKPVMAGYREVSCHEIERQDGSLVCIIEMQAEDDDLRIFKGAR